MMHDREKSDPAIVAEKPTNKAGHRQRSWRSQGWGPRGTRAGKARTGPLGAYDKSQGKGRRRSSRRSYTTSASTYSPVTRAPVPALKRDAAPGVDGLTWRTYEADLDRNLTDLHEFTPVWSSTGRYSLGIACALYEAGHVVSIINPAQIRDFVRTKLGRNKTDRIDASHIREYCELFKPSPWAPPSEAHRRLGECRRFELASSRV